MTFFFESGIDHVFQSIYTAIITKAFNLCMYQKNVVKKNMLIYY